MKRTNHQHKNHIRKRFFSKKAFAYKYTDDVVITRHGLLPFRLLGGFFLAASLTFNTPAHSDAVDIFNEGYDAHGNGELKAAIELYYQAISLAEIPDRRLAYVHHYLGLAWYQLRDHELAIENFNLALVLNPKIHITYRKRGNTYSIMGEFDKAISDYTKSLDHFPDDPDTLNNRGFARYGTGDNIGAIDDYNAALQLDPGLANTYFNRSLAWFLLGDYEKAIADTEETLARKPSDVDALNTRANSYLKLGKYQLAINDYDQAIKINPHSSLPYLNRGIAFYESGNAVRAIKEFDQAILIAPENAENYLNRARAFESLGRNIDAQNDFELAAQYANSPLPYVKIGEIEKSTATSSVTTRPAIQLADNGEKLDNKNEKNKEQEATPQPAGPEPETGATIDAKQVVQQPVLSLKAAQDKTDEPVVDDVTATLSLSVQDEPTEYMVEETEALDSGTFDRNSNSAVLSSVNSNTTESTTDATLSQNQFDTVDVNAEKATETQQTPLLVPQDGEVSTVDDTLTNGDTSVANQAAAEANSDSSSKVAVDDSGIARKLNQALENFDPTALLQQAAAMSSRIENNVADIEAYKIRGWSYYNLGRFDEANGDFQKVIELNSIDVYRIVAIYLASGHAGKSSLDVIQPYIRSGISRRWPGVVLSYFTGEKDEQAIWQYLESTSGRTKRERLCETHFYLGEYHLLLGDLEQARMHYQSVIETDIKEYNEFQGAIRRLATLDELEL